MVLFRTSHGTSTLLYTPGSLYEFYQLWTSDEFCPSRFILKFKCMCHFSFTLVWVIKIRTHPFPSPSILTFLSPTRSTEQGKTTVLPTTAVTFIGVSSITEFLSKKINLTSIINIYSSKKVLHYLWYIHILRKFPQILHTVRKINYMFIWIKLLSDDCCSK